MIVAIYARVSTSKQDETLQLPRLQAYADRMGWTVYKIYQDEASGKNANRPGWMALESDVRRHEFDAVLVTKLDRIMRSLVQLLQVFEDFKTYEVNIITLDQGVLDLRSPNSRLQINLLGMLAEWERELISNRTIEALAAKKAQGVVLGRPKASLPIHTIGLMRTAGKSWADISRELDIPRGTLTNHRKEIEEEAEKIREVIR